MGGFHRNVVYFGNAQLQRREETRQVLLTPSFTMDGRIECEGISQARQPYDSYALWAITGTCRDLEDRDPARHDVETSHMK